MARRVVHIFIFLALACSIPAMAFEEGLSSGNSAPNFNGNYTTGEAFSLGSLEKRPKVISFFWMRNISCIKSLTEIARIEKKHNAAKFIYVNLGEEKAETVQAFINNLPVRPSAVVLAAPSVKGQYLFSNFPHTVFLDENNKVKMVISGNSEEKYRKLDMDIARMETGQHMNEMLEKME